MAAFVVLDNARTLGIYEIFENEGREPKLGLYSNGKLTLVSVKSTTWTDALIQLINKVANFVYEKLGMLNFDEKEIQKAKNVVNKFYLNKQVVHRQTTEEQLSALNTRHTILSSEHKELQLKHGNLAITYDTLQQNYQSLTRIHEEKSRTLKEIEEKLPDLQKKLEEVQQSLTELEPKKQELEAELKKLEPELVANAKKVEQLKNFETAIQSLDNQILRKKIEMTDLCEAIESLKQRIGECATLEQARLKGFKAGEKTAIQRTKRKRIDFPEGNQLYCTQCIGAAQRAVSQQRPTQAIGHTRLQTNISGLCQWPQHPATTAHITSGYYLTLGGC